MWHLAQFNVARAKGPTDGPVMAEFMENLDRINALADGFDGFVWRHQTEAGNSTDVRAFEDDPDLLLNLSVWESADALRDYTYKSDHTAFLHRRREWFEPVADLPPIVLWWVTAGHHPSIEESIGRLRHLAEHGPGPEAFTFRDKIGPPDERVDPPIQD